MLDMCKMAPGACALIATTWLDTKLSSATVMCVPTSNAQQPFSLWAARMWCVARYGVCCAELPVLVQVETAFIWTHPAPKGDGDDRL